MRSYHRPNSIDALRYHDSPFIIEEDESEDDQNSYLIKPDPESNMDEHCHDRAKIKTEEEKEYSYSINYTTKKSQTTSKTSVKALNETTVDHNIQHVASNNSDIKAEPQEESMTPEFILDDMPIAPVLHARQSYNNLQQSRSNTSSPRNNAEESIIILKSSSMELPVIQNLSLKQNTQNQHNFQRQSSPVSDPRFHSGLPLNRPLSLPMKIPRWNTDALEHSTGRNSHVIPDGRQPTQDPRLSRKKPLNANANANMPKPSTENPKLKPEQLLRGATKPELQRPLQIFHKENQCQTPTQDPRRRNVFQPMPQQPNFPTRDPKLNSDYPTGPEGFINQNQQPTKDPRLNRVPKSNSVKEHEKELSTPDPRVNKGLASSMMHVNDGHKIFEENHSIASPITHTSGRTVSASYLLNAPSGPASHVIHSGDDHKISTSNQNISLTTPNTAGKTASGTHPSNAPIGPASKLNSYNTVAQPERRIDENLKSPPTKFAKSDSEKKGKLPTNKTADKRIITPPQHADLNGKRSLEKMTEHESLESGSITKRYDRDKSGARFYKRAKVETEEEIIKPVTPQSLQLVDREEDIPMEERFTYPIGPMGTPYQMSDTELENLLNERNKALDNHKMTKLSDRQISFIVDCLSLKYEREFVENKKKMEILKNELNRPRSYFDLNYLKALKNKLSSFPEIFHMTDERINELKTIARFLRDSIDEYSRVSECCMDARRKCNHSISKVCFWKYAYSKGMDSLIDVICEIDSTIIRNLQLTDLLNTFGGKQGALEAISYIIKDSFREEKCIQYPSIVLDIEDLMEVYFKGKSQNYKLEDAIHDWGIVRPRILELFNKIDHTVVFHLFRKVVVENRYFLYPKTFNWKVLYDTNLKKGKYKKIALEIFEIIERNLEYKR